MRTGFSQNGDSHGPVTTSVAISKLTFAPNHNIGQPSLTSTPLSSMSKEERETSHAVLSRHFNSSIANSLTLAAVNDLGSNATEKRWEAAMNPRQIAEVQKLLMTKDEREPQWLRKRNII